MYKRYIQTICFFTIVLGISGCADGIVGKNTNQNIHSLSNTVDGTVIKTRDSVLYVITRTREELLNYLKSGTRETANSISIGILQGTIGYLDSAENRDRLALFMDSLITHTIGSARVQLIAFRDSLLSEKFINRTRSLLRGVVQELIVHPSEDLVNFALSDHTRLQLDALLEMIVPALLNDKALFRIEKLRSTLVGANMRKDVAGLIDTALITVNNQLKGELGKNLKTDLSQDADVITARARTIIIILAIAVIVVAAAIFFFQQRRLNEKKQMLFYVTKEIENFRNVDPDKFQTLTGNIRQTMLDKQLEGPLRKFLQEEGINKT
jgi:hypothetical protein